MTASMDHKLSIYAIHPNQMKQKLTISAHKNIITSCKFLFTQNMVASASLDKSLKLWDLRKGKQQLSISLNNPCYDMQIS